MDSLTAHGTGGIVPFTEGFLPLLGKYKGRVIPGHSENSSPVIMKGILGSFSLKAHAACLNCPSLLLYSSRVGRFPIESH